MGRLGDHIRVLERFVATHLGSLLSLLIGICARAAIGYMFLTTELLTTAFNSVVWPLVGFVIMPLSTLAYTWAVNDPRGGSWTHVLLVGMCVFTDLYVIGISFRRRRQ